MTISSRYAVFGQPIAHSLSPRIHAAFAAQLNIVLDYRTIEAGPADFANALAAFAAEGGHGANVTLPLKTTAATLCAQVSERARRCGSVNTLIRVGGNWHGDSTDGIGLLRDLAARHAFDSNGRRVLMLGAGGAARAGAFALVDAGAREVVIANRTRTRASDLAAALGPTAHVLQEPIRGPFDLIINATSAGHRGISPELAPAAIGSHTLCYDLSYASAATAFLTRALASSATHVSDGLGMLVEQAAASFELWHGAVPDTTQVFENLRRTSSPTTADPP